MKDKLFCIFQTLIYCVILYGIFAFIMWEINPTEWGTLTRLLYMFLAICPIFDWDGVLKEIEYEKRRK